MELLSLFCLLPLCPGCSEITACLFALLSPPSLGGISSELSLNQLRVDIPSKSMTLIPFQVDMSHCRLPECHEAKHRQLQCAHHMRHQGCKRKGLHMGNGFTQSGT